MLLNANKITPELLRQKVTSKDGTTQSAIEYFDRNNFRDIIQNGILKALERVILLSKE